MKFVFKAIAGLLLLVLFSVALLLFLVPANTFKPLIENAASDALGRNVSIGKDLNWAFWPPISIQISGLTISNAPDLTPPEMVIAEEISLKLNLLAYASGTLALDELRLVKPQISLHKNADGKANWEFGEPQGTETPNPEQSKSDESGGLPTIEIGTIEIIDGDIDFEDESSGSSHALTGINVKIAQEGKLLSLASSVLFNDRALSLDGSVDDLNATLAGAPASIDFAMLSDFATMSAKGAVGADQAQGIEIDGKVGDVRALLNWLQLGVELPEPAPNDISLQAMVSAEPAQIQIDEFGLQAGAIEVGGSGRVELADRPKISAVLDLGKIDLSPWMPPKTEVESPQPDGDAQETGWSDKPLDLPLPLPVDADLSLAFSSIKTDTIETGSGSVSLYSDNLSVKVEVPSLELYDGSTELALVIEDFRETPAVKLRALVADVAAEPLLKAAAGFDQLAGGANFQAEVQTAGQSLKEMIEGLQGNGSLLFRDGAIIGINIAATLRQISSLGLGADSAEERRTDFAELGGSFTITNGIVDNQDLQLRAPVLRLVGAGSVDLPTQSLDYAITPRVSATLEGQDASNEPVIGAGIPLIINGPWSDPQIQLAIGGTLTGDLRDPEAIANLVGQLTTNPEQLVAIREQFGGGGGALDAIGDLVGGNVPDLEAGKEEVENVVNEAEDKIDELKEGLGGLLKR